MKRKATLLLLFLVAGQFLACLFSTQKLWPFNPILVYVEPVADKVTETSLVAFRGALEEDVVDLGWVDWRLVGRLVAPVRQATGEVQQRRAFIILVDLLRPSAEEFEGLRLYETTWSLSKGEATEKQLVLEVSF
tara:strand:- start:286 stop:687 length:402 start_codon:yes stop_codon:yes gene_type:complete